MLGLARCVAPSIAERGMPMPLGASMPRKQAGCRTCSASALALALMRRRIMPALLPAGHHTLSSTEQWRLGREGVQQLQCEER